MADADAAPLRLLFLNAFLLRPVTLGWGRWRWEPGAAPAVADRACELGEVVAGAHDVVALAEAFRPEDRARVLRAWAGRPHQVAVGPEAGWSRPAGATTVSSGLMTVAAGPAIVRRDTVRFTVRGHRLADADPWAAKGVLLVELDVGLPGRVELYSTHLCAGGGLLPVGGDRAAGTDAVRRAQAEELAAFVARTHRPGNLVVVVGDMNVEEHRPGAADPRAAHRDLAAALGAVGLDDLWERLDLGWGPTCGLDATALVAHDPRSAGGSPDHAWPTGGRIDRVFLARPTPADRVTVGAARLRRRALPRRAGAPERHRLAHLSDHLGLELALDLRAAAVD